MFASLRDLSQEERTKKLADVRGKIDKKAEDVLLDHQKTRLNELYIQVQGAAALADPKIAEALKITDDQKTKITAAHEELMQAFATRAGTAAISTAKKLHRFAATATPRCWPC